MELAINHEKLHGRMFTVRTASFFRAPRLLSGGMPVQGKRGTYTVRDNQGKEITIKLKGNFLDPIPKLAIDGQELQLAPPLAWYEYVWMGLPIILVFAGGALGAIFGMSAAYASSRIFRSERGTASKYLISGLFSVAAVVGFFILVVLLQILLHGVPQG
jgi:hypothetical protein